MRHSLSATIAAAAAATVLFSGAPAAAHGYNGTWPVTISDSQRSDGTGCLTLKGYELGGQASLVFGSQKYTYGSYEARNNLFFVTITEPLYGQNGALLFVVPLEGNRFGKGDYENIEGGSNFDFGSVKFGRKNAC